jgi:hypothetical protein
LRFKGSTDAEIYSERDANGTVVKSFLKSGKLVALQQRLAWCQETTEAVA